MVLQRCCTQSSGELPEWEPSASPGSDAAVAVEAVEVVVVAVVAVPSFFIQATLTKPNQQTAYLTN